MCCACPYVLVLPRCGLAAMCTSSSSIGCVVTQELDTTLQVLGIDGAPAESSMSSPHALGALRRDSSSGFRLHHSESGGTLRYSLRPNKLLHGRPLQYRSCHLTVVRSLLPVVC